MGVNSIGSVTCVICPVQAQLTTDLLHGFKTEKEL